MAKAHTLIDRFNDNSIDTDKWGVRTSNGGTVVEVGRKIQLSIAPENGSIANLHSKDMYDLTDSSISVEAYIQSVQGDVRFFVYQGEPQNFLGFRRVFGFLFAYYYTDGGEEVALLEETYNPVEHKWIRIRESSGTIYLDSSPDGIVWQNLESATTPFDLTSVEINMSYIQRPSSTLSGSVEFDDFNITPMGKRPLPSNI